MLRTILIVDDSEVCAETLEIALETMPGFATRTVRTPGAALSAMREENHTVAALVTDLHVARHDGLELIGKIRADARFTHLPIVLISGESDPGLPQRALAAGADAFFGKPYSPAAVRRKLEQLLC